MKANDKRVSVFGKSSSQCTNGLIFIGPIYAWAYGSFDTEFFSHHTFSNTCVWFSNCVSVLMPEQLILLWCRQAKKVNHVWSEHQWYHGMNLWMKKKHFEKVLWIWTEIIKKVCFGESLYQNSSYWQDRKDFISQMDKSRDKRVVTLIYMKHCWFLQKRCLVPNLWG